MVEHSSFKERIEQVSESFELATEAIGSQLEWMGEVQVPLPSFPVSGSYEANVAINPPVGASLESRSTFPSSANHESGMSGQFGFSKEELRLDVDRFYPQMTVSGTIHRFLMSQTNWVAALRPTGPKSWSGSIWYKDGDTTYFPYTNVDIKAVGGSIPRNRSAIMKFSAPDGQSITRTYSFKSPYFRKVDFEFDYAEFETPTTSINTCEHPNHPANLPCENLSIEQAYKSSGFDVTVTPGGVVPISNASENRLWSDAEMHDAMKTYWSRFADMPQWAMWVFFAAKHEMGESLGGIMFDDVGPNHRQGTAIFNDSFISKAPQGDPNPNAWAMRMIFWTACHEMGHAFNLAHSWQKTLGSSWIPLADEPEARSFMNYPYRVRNGEKAFFADFEYRFSDAELLFMRHSPERFVQMGNADWFDHHGFQEANVSPNPALKLGVRVNREKPIFDFMEPVTLELKLTNTSSQPQLVDKKVLADVGMMTVIIKKDRQPARQFVPYAKYLWTSEKQVLLPGESLYEPLFVSAGLNGWDIADPGNYMMQIALHTKTEDFVSNQVGVRVAPPTAFSEEHLAQDFFSDDVGRTIFFNGTQELSAANNTLREVSERMSGRRVSAYANYALGNPFTRNYKSLDVKTEEGIKKLTLNVQPAQPEEAKKYIYTALVENNETAVETFGHIEYKRQVDQFSDWLVSQGATEEAISNQETLYQTLSSREVNGRRVIQPVFEDIRNRQAEYESRLRRAA